MGVVLVFIAFSSFLFPFHPKGSLAQHDIVLSVLLLYQVFSHSLEGVRFPSVDTIFRGLALTSMQVCKLLDF